SVGFATNSNNPLENTKKDPEMSTTKNKSRFLAAAKDFLARAEALTADLGLDVMDTVDEVVRLNLAESEARAMYKRVLQILEKAKKAGAVDAVAADSVRAAVRSAAGLNDRSSTEEPKRITLVERTGLKPRLVRPIPEFMGKQIVVTE